MPSSRSTNSANAGADDNKHAKYAAEQQEQQSASFVMMRRIFYYILLSTFVADCYASKAETMMHLTMWSYFLHLLYFELPLGGDQPKEPQSFTSTLVLWLHGPSFSGAHALFAMYLWTLYANPDMEFDLAPPGRAVWMVYLRAFWLHAGPVILHWMDLRSVPQQKVLQQIYQTRTSVGTTKNLLYFWASVGGYLAMGLTWEQVNGDATGTYKIETMSEETYVNVSKLLGVAACVASFLVGTKAYLLDPLNL